MLVIRLRPLEDLFPRHGKLRATSDANHLRHLLALHQRPPSSRVIILRRFARIGRVAKRLNFIRTSYGRVAPQVGVAILLDEVQLELLYGDDVVVVGRVIVPGLRKAVAVRVQEDDGLGEVVVVLHDVGQVDVRFAAFVSVDVEGGGGVVDDVDGALPAVI